MWDSCSESQGGNIGPMWSGVLHGMHPRNSCVGCSCPVQTDSLYRFHSLVYLYHGARCWNVVLHCWTEDDTVISPAAEGGLHGLWQYLRGSITVSLHHSHGSSTWTWSSLHMKESNDIASLTGVLISKSSRLPQLVLLSFHAHMMAPLYTCWGCVVDDHVCLCTLI